jgi:flagellar protein FlaG
MDFRPIPNKPQSGLLVPEKVLSVTGSPAVASKAREEGSAQPPGLAQVTQAVHNLNKMMQSLSPDLEFSIDDESNQTIVKLVDQQTKEVIRQIPTKDTIEIAKALDRVQGLLIKQKA